MKTIDSFYNVEKLIVDYFTSLECKESDVCTFIEKERYDEALILKLSAVCLVAKNKPEDSSSKQSHIHVTSSAREFFYSINELEDSSSSNDWEKQELYLCPTNIDSLNNASYQKEFETIESYTMKKIAHRKNQATQVQISKIREDDRQFIKLRNGLYVNDLLIFLKSQSSNRVFTIGIPSTFVQKSYNVKYTGEVFHKNINNEIDKHIKKKINDIYELQEEVSYQSAVNNSETPLNEPESPQIYISKRDSLKKGLNSRPSTNPAIGKRVIKNMGYCCSVDMNHESFLKEDGTKYIEVHHLIPMCEQDKFTYKLDTEANIIPLCPTCHRMLHFGRQEDIEPVLKKLYIQRIEALRRSNIAISFEELLSYYL